MKNICFVFIFFTNIAFSQIGNEGRSPKFFFNVSKITNSSVKSISEIDLNIPINARINSSRYALIVGNEDYTSQQKGLNSEVNVDFAVNDAKIFKEYATKTFGIPADNIIYLENGKTVEMNRAIKTMNSILKNSNGKSDIYFYYAGHGFPDENTKDSYLIPVDVSGTDLQFAIKLSDLYKLLTEFPSKRITIILDACFSGGGRNQGLLANRGVKIKPKENLINGNLVVITACSGEQSAASYKVKQHGFFTYFLLKKIQESNGDISYKELSDYLIEQVSIKSALLNQKEQNPQILVSPDVKDTWETWGFK